MTKMLMLLLDPSASPGPSCLLFSVTWRCYPALARTKLPHWLLPWTPLAIEEKSPVSRYRKSMKIAPVERVAGPAPMHMLVSIDQSPALYLRQLLLPSRISIGRLKSVGRKSSK